jgi:hypothetical protein
VHSAGLKVHEKSLFCQARKGRRTTKMNFKIKVVMSEGGADLTDRGHCTMAGFSISDVQV